MLVLSSIGLLLLGAIPALAQDQPHSHLQANARAPSSSSATSTYAVPAGFPSSLFPEYYYGAAWNREPQPKIYDPILHATYPLNLTDPNTIPTNDTDPAILPPSSQNATAAQADGYMQAAIKKIQTIVSANNGTNCTKCVDSLQVLQDLSKQAPDRVADTMTQLCSSYKLHSNSTCEEDFGLYTLGSIWTQAIRYGNIQGLDGRYMCYYISSTTCPKPVAYPAVNATSMFPKPKPMHAKAPKPSGQKVKVLHMSDIHLDPRYAVGSESNCSSNLCCRTNVHASSTSNVTVSPAPLYGAYACDSPYFLTTAALRSVHPLTGTKAGPAPYSGWSSPDATADCACLDESRLGWTIYTGDLVSHDSQDQLSRAYTEYAETSIYSMIKQLISGPVFAVLGNHDTNPEAQDAPHSLPSGLGQQMSWNYDHVAGLWLNDGFISASAAAEARVHYGGYSVKNHFGLRIITLNTDFWYHSNVFNYINASNPDTSGMLRWLIDELQSAEDCGERVWIMGHVLTGWDGSNPLPLPTDFFYQIIERYSPHVIANTFWGHTHEDEIMIYYANNGTNRNNPTLGSRDALIPGWVGPSVTPLTNLNSGFRMYEVDTGSFDIYDAYTYYSNVSAFHALNPNATGPTYQLEYSTRDAYGPAAAWPADAPLNGTFWHAVTVAFEQQANQGNLALTELFNTYQGKTSVRSPACNTTACALAKICYMRSGSNPLGAECPQGYGSVQSAFTPSS